MYSAHPTHTSAASMRAIEIYFVVVLISAVVGIRWLLMRNQAAKARRARAEEKIRDTFNGVVNFNPSIIVISIDGSSGIAIDEDAGTICVVSGGAPEPRVIPSKDLLASELVIDGSSESSAVRSSQIGGALVGAALLGGVGAIIGGLSARSRTTATVSSIAVRISINDMTNPLHEVFLLALPAGFDGSPRSDPKIKALIEQGQRLHAQLEILIRRADSVDRKKEPSSP